MRAYFWCNYYLSSIQQGIQSAHCLAEMMITTEPGHKQTQLHDWATNYKTLIVLNGGNSAQLAELFNDIQNFGVLLNLPVAKFSEDEQSLNSALTCVGMIVPESVYGLSDDPNSEDPLNWFSPERRLNGLISQYPLAR